MNAIKNVFAIDLRSLALYRVVLGLLIVVYTLCLWPSFTDLFTDKGVLPRSDAIRLASPWLFSLHFLSTSLWFQRALLIGQILCGLGLAVGYRTRLMSIAAWLLVISLQNRNTMMLNGGDIMLALLLFWNMFLPLGARFSVDAVLAKPKVDAEPRYFSMASMALLLQIASLYFFGFLLKSDPIWWPDGTATYYALQLDSFTTPIGHWLGQFPTVLRGITYYVLAVEAAAPVLIFSPFYNSACRLSMLSLMASLHIAFYLCMHIGLFSQICLTMLLAFLPTAVWDYFRPRLETSERQGIILYFDEGCEFCYKTCLLLRQFFLLTSTPILPAQKKPEIDARMQQDQSWVVADAEGNLYTRWTAMLFVIRSSLIFSPLYRVLALARLQRWGEAFYQWVADNRAQVSARTAVFLRYRPYRVGPNLLCEIIVSGLLVMVIFANLATVKRFPLSFPKELRPLQTTLRLGQIWNMFAPYPSHMDGWYTMPGTLLDGRVFDISTFKTEPVDWSTPKSLYATYKNTYWRKYLNRTRSRPYQGYLLPYGRFICRRWNSTHTGAERLDRFRIYFNLRKVLPDYRPRSTESLLIWRHWCFKPPRRRR